MEKYAITKEDGSTIYDLDFETASSMFSPGCRIWKSENGGDSYLEIFIQ
jgi:hypothetical protein